MTLGIDISHHQNFPNFVAVKNSGVQFVIIKATEGVQYIDPCFHQNVKAALAAGLQVGAYHLLRSTPIDQQCDDFLAAIKPYKLTFPVAIDVENPASNGQVISEVSNLGKAEITRRILYFADRMFAAGHKDVLCYSNNPWFSNYIDLAQVKAHGIKIWLAWYSNATPTNTNRSNQCNVWQYASDGKINGINGAVDMDVCYSDFSISKPVTVSCDAPTLNLVEGNTYQYRITASSSSKPNVVIANNQMIKLTYVSNTGNDYFYKVTAIGTSPASIGLYVNGSRESVITIIKPNSDTNGNFTIKKGQTYQFKSNTCKVVSGNQNVAKYLSQTFSNGNYYTKFQMIGSVGDRVGFYIGNGKNPTAICQVV